MNFRKKREEFINKLANLKKTKEQWKEPDIYSILYYKGRRLPLTYILYDKIVTNRENTKYLGENKYSLKTENISIEEKYEMIRNIVDVSTNHLNSTVSGTGYEKDCNVLLGIANVKLNIAKMKEKEDLNRAVELLDRFLPEVIDFYNRIKEEDCLIEEI